MVCKILSRNVFTLFTPETLTVDPLIQIQNGSSPQEDQSSNRIWSHCYKWFERYWVNTIFKLLVLFLLKRSNHPANSEVFLTHGLYDNERKKVWRWMNKRIEARTDMAKSVYLHQVLEDIIIFNKCRIFVSKVPDNRCRMSQFRHQNLSRRSRLWLPWHFIGWQISSTAVKAGKSKMLRLKNHPMSSLEKNVLMSEKLQNMFQLYW